MTYRMTLDPAPGVDPLDLPRHIDPANSRPESRRVLVFPGPVTLTARWTSATLADGRAVEVRSAPCGLDCHCAGEFRWPRS